MSSTSLEVARDRFLSGAAPSGVQSHLYQAQIDMMRAKEENTDYSPPDAYWRGLWAKPPDKHLQGRVIVQLQGSVVRVKSRRPVGEKTKVFSRDWNTEPDVYSNDFALDGYDRFNTNDREQFGASRPKGNKAPIHEFSSNSRRLLLDRLMSLRPEAWDRALFWTLTYHEKWPEPARAKADLRAFFKRLVRHAEKSKNYEYKPAMFWRMEIKPRLSGDREGELAPHFHLFLFGCPAVPYVTALRWWHEITGDYTITFLNMKRLDNRRKAMNYVAKYVAKPSQADNALSSAVEVNGSMDFAPNLDISLYLAGMGRFWGLEGGDCIPVASLKEVIFEPLDASLLKFISVCEEKYEFLTNRWSYGFRLFVFAGELEKFEDVLSRKWKVEMEGFAVQDVWLEKNDRGQYERTYDSDVYTVYK